MKLQQFLIAGWLVWTSVLHIPCANAQTSHAAKPAVNKRDWFEESVPRSALEVEQPRFESLKPIPDESMRKAEQSHTITPTKTVPRVQWWMFTSKTCGPCQRAKADFTDWLKQSDWVVDDSQAAHVRLIEVASEGELVSRFRVQELPCFLLMVDGRETLRSEAYPGRKFLVDRYRAATEKLPPLAGTISVGTIPGQKEHVARLISQMQQLLGEEGSLTIQLDRKGNSTVEIPVGEHLQLSVSNPLRMNFTQKNGVLACRFQAPFPRGRWTQMIPLDQPISGVTVSVSEVILELPHAPDLRWKISP